MKRNDIIIGAIIMSMLMLMLMVGCGNTSTAAPDNSPKTVQDYDITITIIDGKDTFDIDGKYTGEVVDGTPNGQGVFVAESEDNARYEYEGSFSSGYFDGYGITNITNDDGTLQMAGTYTKGEFTPTPGESFNYIGQLDLFGKFSLSDDVIEYIDTHSELFPTANKDEIQTISTQEFSSKQFNKTRKQEKIGLVKLDLYAVQVFEDDYMDGKLTYILGADDEGSYYALYYLGSADIYDEDTFTAYAVPCATSSFENVGGGTTNVIVMAASYVD